MGIRNLNEGLVLKTIEENGLISRADICKRIGLTPPTVSDIAKDLIERGIVNEIGKGDSSGGKRPILLKLNPGAAYMLAVDLGGENGIRAALMDLSNNIIKERVGPKIELLKGEELKYVLSVTVSDLIKGVDVPRNKILGICIGVPGIIDFKLKKVTIAPYLNWEISLEDLALKKIGVPITIENDVNLMALGERAKGIAQGIDNFVFIGERIGIGAGIVTNGKLYTGANNAAGEAGYLLIDAKYVHRNNKGYGCFEKLASYKAIAEKARSKMNKTMGALEVFKAAAKGERVAIDIVKETLKFLAYGISNVSCVLDPELVAIGGGISILPDDFLEEIKENIKEVIPLVPRIGFSKLGEDGVLVGAAVKVFESLKREGLALVK
ncbi:MAG: ROK family transcriptional regulator [Candidatus Aerophobetes bacterium]|nr:ROK family transcriptional regulator [Candidatus Aerophobetes bacterium]